MKFKTAALRIFLCGFLSLLPVSSLFSDFVDDVEEFNGRFLDLVTWETRFISPGEMASQDDVLQLVTEETGDFAYSTRDVGVLPGQTISVWIEITDELNSNSTTAAAMMLSTKDGQSGIGNDSFRLIAQINENTNNFQSFVNNSGAGMGSTSAVLGNRFRLEMERAFPSQTRFRVFDASNQQIGSSVRSHSQIMEPLFVSMTMRGGVALFDDVTIPNIGPVEVELDNITIERGILVEGAVESTLGSEDDYIALNPGFTLSSAEAPVRLILESAFPIESPLTLNMTFESGANTVGIEQTIELLNWNTGDYELVDARQASLVDEKLGFVLTDGIDDFIQRDTRRINVRVRFKQNGFIFAFPWTARIDVVQYFLN